MTTTYVSWTSDEDRLLWRYVADGLSAGAIARRMDRAESSVNRRIEIIAKQNSQTRRPCMCCRNEFMSDGPHNRLCNTCRKTPTTPFQH